MFLHKMSNVFPLFQEITNFRLSLCFHPIFVGRGYDLAGHVTVTELLVIAEIIPIRNTLPISNREGIGKAIALPYSWQSL
jgi:hypothetical protein